MRRKWVEQALLFQLDIRRKLYVLKRTSAGSCSGKTSQPQSSPASPAGGTEVTAPMPGSVLEVKVQPGQQVKEGYSHIRAMKMENELLGSV